MPSDRWTAWADRAERWWHEHRYYVLLAAGFVTVAAVMMAAAVAALLGWSLAWLIRLVLTGEP